MRLHVHIAGVILAFAGGGVFAQPQCQFYLANQTGGNQGFSLHLDGAASAGGSCSLNSVSLALTVGDGNGYHHVTAAPAWQSGVVYTVQATISGAGPQQVSLNGQSLGSGQAAFQPAQGALNASEISPTQTATPAYVITQISLQVTNGSNNVSLAPNGSAPVPLPLVLMAAGGALWAAPFAPNAAQPLTVTATFRFDAAVANLHQFDPFVDGYGQTTFTTWPSKVNTDADFQTALATEQAWLAANPRVAGFDSYGGSLLAGWTDKATNYYHTAFHNNRWWLISPLGNSLFYIGLTGIYEDSTPVTGRESMFSASPPQTGEFAPAYAQNVYADPQPTTYLSFATANLIRKYGAGWQAARNASTLARLASWGFAGSGKWTHVGSALTVPVNPVLSHGDVPNVVAGGHPDVFDPVIVSQLKTSLTAQIGSNATNPYIIGWSVGNEDNEILSSGEVQAILALGANVPAKQKLVDHALSAIYSGGVSALAAAWKVTASTVAEVYASKPAPPAADVEALRQFYEQSYYAALNQAVKAIDPNHLYFGSWILARTNPVDWPIAAANCDVVGIDLYAPLFSEPGFLAELSAANKPVLLGEFSFPSAYGGMRGFGTSKYSGEITFTDVASGDAYAQWLHDASANPLVVGVEWFSYRDEAITGRGNNTGVGNASSSLVIGENFAFGMVDITDTPKYDLVNKVRAANLAALQLLGMLGAAPSLTSAPANGATYLSGGLVPGSWAQVKGANLSAVSRVWTAADFTGLGNKLPVSLSGVQVTVNNLPAAVYFVDPGQVNFQVPNGVTGTASVTVTNNGVVSNSLTAPAAPSAPGIFPVIVNGVNYPAGVFLDGKFVGDPAAGSVFRKAKAGDIIQLYATGLTATPAGVVPAPLTVSGVTVTVGTVAAQVLYAGLVAVGEFQINFTVPPEFATMPESAYPITIAINGVSSPAAINSNPPGPLVVPIQH